jgi:hypothetical protein
VRRSIDPRHPAIRAARERGLIPPQSGDDLPPGRGKHPPMVEPSFGCARGAGGAVLSAVWVIPVRTVSEANARGRWAQAGRVHGQRSAVCRALAPCWRVAGPLGDHYRSGRPLRVELVRLGGRGLDRGVNLPRALKAIEDATCLVLGTDDGSPLWRVSWGQEAGGPWGVRVTIEAVQ